MPYGDELVRKGKIKLVELAVRAENGPLKVEVAVVEVAVK